MDDANRVKPVFLAEETISQDDLKATTDWMLAGNRLTKAEVTTQFEAGFAEWMGTNCAVYVNSGSSANLLMIYAAKESGRLRNNKVIAPAVSWVTTILEMRSSSQRIVPKSHLVLGHLI